MTVAQCVNYYYELVFDCSLRLKTNNIKYQVEKTTEVKHVFTFTYFILFNERSPVRTFIRTD